MFTCGSTGTQVDTGALILNTPAAYTHLSVLAAAGGGNTTINYQVNYMDGNVEFGSLNILDWWTTNNANTATTAWIANGSFQGTDGSYQRVNTTPQNARLFYTDTPLSFPSSLVSNIVFTYTAGGRVAIFGLSGSTDNAANFNPIPVRGFNYDMILEAPLAKYVTATVDGGLLTVNSRGDNNVWFEQGFNSIDVSRPWVGLPKAGTIFNAWSNSAHAFQMPPTYTTNCAIMVNNQVASGTFNLTTPTALSALSILGSSGNGPVLVNLTINHQDGTFEATNFYCLDWFANLAFSTNWNVACSAAGRVATGRINVINNSGGLTGSLLLFSDIALTNATSPVTSVQFSYVSGGRTAIFGLSGSTDNATYVPLAVSGFNQDMVVEATACTSMNFRSLVTGSMDGGTNLNGNTWYEMGYNRLAPTSGLPAPGSIIASTNLPDHKYQFAPSYAGPNAVYCDSNNPVANIVFATPTNYSAVSFLSATANQGIQVQVILNHDDGSKETNVFTARDWFNNVPAAFTANGRVNNDSRAVNNWLPGTSNPRLYEAQFALQDTVHNVTGATLIWTTNNGSGGVSSATSRFAVLAASGVIGAAPPILATSPTNVQTFEGSNVVLSATISGGTLPMTFKWEAGTNNVWSTVANSTVISGANTTNLTFTGIGWTNSADYRFIASNAGGSVTSYLATVTAFSVTPDVTRPGDPIAFYNGSTTAGEGVEHVIDNLGQKYLNFGLNGGTPFAGPVGFVVTPTLGNTIVSAMRLYTANDATQRDPADFVLEGSNDGGNSWMPIASGPLNLPTGRNAGGSSSVILNASFTNFVQEVHFGNATAYGMYRWSVNNVRDNTTANSMQIAEVELLGVAVGTRPTILVQPVPAVKVFAGASPSFSIVAFGFPTNLVYQWYVNGSTAIPGATNASYTLSHAQQSDSGKTFTCTVVNSAGSATSSSATLTVIPAPTTSYAVSIMNDSPLAYFRLDEADNGQGNAGVVATDYFGGHNGVYTNTFLSQAGYPATPADGNTAAQFGDPFYPILNDSCVRDIPGIDFARATNQAAAAFSVEAWVKGIPDQMYDAGIITKGTGNGGEQFSLDTGGTGAGTHGMRFYVRDASGTVHSANTGTNAWDNNWHHLVGVCDAANSNITLYVDGLVSSVAAITPANGLLSSASPVSIGARRSNDNTNYNFQFFGNIDEVAVYGYALSRAQVQTHYYAAGIAPVFTTQPTNTAVAQGTPATLYAGAHGTPTISYQWYRSVDNGASFSPLGGQTSSNLTFAVATAAENGLYHVVATSTYGSATSADAQLTVVGGAPVIISDIRTQTVVFVGQTFSLPVTFGGTAPFTYSWQHNGQALSDTVRISGTHSNVLSIANAQPSDAGAYQVFASNGQGSGASALGTVIVVSTSLNTNGIGWALNGLAYSTNDPATIANGVLTLSTSKGSSARSAWFTNRQYIASFETWFTYQDVGGAGADGMAFVVHNDSRGTTALGGGGGTLGVGGITPSAELELNIYANNTPGLAYHTGGATGGYSATGPVNVASGNPIRVHMLYAGGQAAVTLTDLTTAQSYSTTIATGDLPSILGGESAYVGFTGADGGTVSTQTISDFQFVPRPVLNVQPTSTNTLVLSWPAGIVGYVLQEKADLAAGSWQEVAAPVTTVGNKFQAVVPFGSGRFYRLAISLQ